MPVNHVGDGCERLLAHNPLQTTPILRGDLVVTKGCESLGDILSRCGSVCTVDETDVKFSFLTASTSKDRRRSGCRICVISLSGCPLFRGRENRLRGVIRTDTGGVRSVPVKAVFFGVLEKHFLDSVSTRIPKKFFGDIRTGCGLEVSHSHTLEGTNLLVIGPRFCNKRIAGHINSSVHTLEFDVIAVRSHHTVLA